MLTHAEHAGMAGGNLLEQGRSGARHANDKYRYTGGIGAGNEAPRGKSGDNAVNVPMELFAVESAPGGGKGRLMFALRFELPRQSKK